MQSGIGNELVAMLEDLEKFEAPDLKDTHTSKNLVLFLKFTLQIEQLYRDPSAVEDFRVFWSCTNFAWLIA